MAIRPTRAAVIQRPPPRIAWMDRCDGVHYLSAAQDLYRAHIARGAPGSRATRISQANYLFRCLDMARVRVWWPVLAPVGGVGPDRAARKYFGSQFPIADDEHAVNQ